MTNRATSADVIDFMAISPGLCKIRYRDKLAGGAVTEGTVRGDGAGGTAPWSTFVEPSYRKNATWRVDEANCRTPGLLRAHKGLLRQHQPSPSVGSAAATHSRSTGDGRPICSRRAVRQSPSLSRVDGGASRWAHVPGDSRAH